MNNILNSLIIFGNYQIMNRNLRTPTFLGYIQAKRWIFAVFFCLSIPVSWADITDVTIADLNTRSFSVVWLSDEVIDDATVRVFTDIDGLNEITSGLSVNLISTNFPPAHDQGIVKVDIIGLTPDTTVYIQTKTTGLGGIVQYPAPGALIALTTAIETSRVNGQGGPITNDLIGHEVLDPDGQTPAAGALILVKVPDQSIYPLSGFVADGFQSPLAVIDLNNVFNDTVGMSVEIAAGTVLEVTEFRGLRCNPDEHKLLHYRKAPDHIEDPAITELEVPALCFFADTVCDDVVNILDVQRVLNIFNEALGSCTFNPDLDIVNDAVINILDVQSVLNRFGQQAPFL